jgi:hypothetical protein
VVKQTLLKIMTEQERNMEITIFIGMCKMVSDNSTMLIGEFKQEKKHRFNTMVSSVDNFIKCIENDLSDYNKETLLILAESLNDGIVSLRKELQEAV